MPGPGFVFDVSPANCSFTEQFIPVLNRLGETSRNFHRPSTHSAFLINPKTFAQNPLDPTRGLADEGASCELLSSRRRSHHGASPGLHGFLHTHHNPERRT